MTNITDPESTRKLYLHYKRASYTTTTYLTLAFGALLGGIFWSAFAAENTDLNPTTLAALTAAAGGIAGVAWWRYLIARRVRNANAKAVKRDLDEAVAKATTESKEEDPLSQRLITQELLLQVVSRQRVFAHQARHYATLLFLLLLLTYPVGEDPDSGVMTDYSTPLDWALLIISGAAAVVAHLVILIKRQGATTPEE